MAGVAGSGGEKMQTTITEQQSNFQKEKKKNNHLYKISEHIKDGEV